MNVIRLTEEKLKEIIEETVKKTLQEYHGLDIDRDSRTVHFTDEHERNLDTSLKSNPTSYDAEICGMQVMVYSLFQRKRGIHGDGNPALYALKREKRWMMDNEDAFMERFKLVLNKFLSEHSNNVVVPIPSTNLLNNRFADAIKETIPDIKFCSPIGKMSTDEVWDYCDEADSYFCNFWREKEVDLNVAFDMLGEALTEMNETNDGIFSYHHIKDWNLRNSIIHTLKALPKEHGRYRQDIDGNDILLIDDSITRGQTIEDAIFAIQQLYEPRSISVLTIFSNLKD